MSMPNRSPLVAAVLPARFASTRFEGKPLQRDTGKYLIQHVYERASEAKSVSRVIVATDDSRIFEAVESFGGEAVMTRTDHANGTSRLAEAAETLDEQVEIIVNVQGDEPEIEPSAIDIAVETLLANRDAVVSTLASPLAPGEDADDPNIVKVVRDLDGNALYFSRSRIPFDREGEWDSTGAVLLKHLGLYVYRREFLSEYIAWDCTPLECAERLEQLRILEHGKKITVAVIDEPTRPGIDTPEQYAAFVKRWRARSLH